MLSGKALNREHRKLFSTTSGSDHGNSPVGLPEVLIEPQFEPLCLVEAAKTLVTIVAFGQRPESLSGRGGEQGGLSLSRRRYSASDKSGKIARCLDAA
jgi:hypothetical protein